MITGSVIELLYPRMRQLKWWDWDKPYDNETGSDTQKDLGEGYRDSVRNRVIKDAVKEAPTLFN
jgi:inner membrane protease subunit 2